MKNKLVSKDDVRWTREVFFPTLKTILREYWRDRHAIRERKRNRKAQ